MIDELRILTDVGVSVYMGSFNRNSRKFEEGRTTVDFLFAGLISAILNVSAEVQSETVQEISFRRNRMVLYTSGELIFVATTNEKVPIDEINTVLESVSVKVVKLLDSQYSVMTSEQIDEITRIIQRTLIEKFWWAQPSLTPKNTLKFYNTAIFHPDRTYYFGFLPRKFFILGLIPAVFPLLIAGLFGTEFAGLATKPVFEPNLIKNLGSILIIWIGTAVIIKLYDMKKFQLANFMMITGVYLTLITIMLFFGSFYYRYNLIGPLVVDFNLQDYKSIILFLTVRIPVNLSFFGYFIISGYGTLFASNFRSRRYLIIYTVSTLLMVFLTEMVNFIF